MATPKKKNKGWDQEVMLAAMKACAEEGLTVYEASKRFGVPRTTLFQRVKASVDPLCSAGRLTSLSKEEIALVHYIKSTPHNNTGQALRQPNLSMAEEICLANKSNYCFSHHQGVDL